MKRIFDCGVLLRIFILVQVGMFAHTAIAHDDSMLYQVAHADRFTLMAMAALAILTMLGAVDLVVNDLLPERFVLLRSLDWRHLVNMGMAMCFAVQLWSCVRYELSTAPVPFYVSFIFFIPLSALADVRKRYKKAT